MVDSPERKRRRGALPLSAAVGRVIDPLAQRRGFAAADMIAAWTEIVGAAIAQCTEPEKIVWPRGEANADLPGVMTLKVEGPRAIFIQHELDQILERVNAFLGYAAVGQIRLVQAPINRRKAEAAKPAPELAPDKAAQLAETIATVEDERLRAALDRLGRGALANKQA